MRTMYSKARWKIYIVGSEYMRFIKNNRGFTLVEVLAVILILSIVSTILFSILSSSKETNKKQLENNEQLSELSYVLKLITKDMRKPLRMILIIQHLKTEMVLFNTHISLMLKKYDYS